MSWSKVNNGYLHSKTRCLVSKRTNGNPHRNGDWFCSYSGFGMTPETTKKLATSFPANGVKTLKAAKKIVESIG